MPTATTRTINRLRNAERALIALLLILLPVQFGKHVWPNFAFVRGLRIDYLSPTLFLTDVLLVGVLVVWLMQRWLGGGRGSSRRNAAIVLTMLAFAIANTLRATSPPVTAIAWLRLFLLAAAGMMIAASKIVSLRFLRLLEIPLVYSSLLAIGQFINFGSLGGMLSWLGERTFTSATPGIAKTEFMGRVLLRPYATFPHPNALAGFLVVAVALTSGSESSRTWRRLVVGLAALALASTFSLSGWLAALLLVATFATTSGLVRVITAVAIPVLLLVNVHQEPKAVENRLVLARQSLVMLRENPLLGVGLGGFIPGSVEVPASLPSRSMPASSYQPVHNLFLLVAAEAGLIAAGAFIWVLSKSLRIALLRHNPQALAALLVIILTGLVDHYWLTLQQNRLLLTIVLAMIWKKHKR